MSRAFEDPIYDEVSGPVWSIEAMAEIVAECKRLRAELGTRDAAIERLKTTLGEKDHEIAGLMADKERLDFLESRSGGYLRAATDDARGVK